MNVVVTGCNGFIGKHLLKRLIADNHCITGFARCAINHGKTSNTIIKIRKDLSKIKTQDLKGHQVLIHTAAVGVSPQKAKLHELIKTNIIDSIDLVNKAIKAGIKLFVFTGSYGEYGYVGKNNYVMSADFQLLPLDFYSWSKSAFFTGLIPILNQNNIKVNYYRLFNVYGDGQNPANFWPQLKNSAITGSNFNMSSGGQVRDFVQIEKVTKHISSSLPHLAKRKRFKLKVQNIGNGNRVTLRDFAMSEWQRLGAVGEIQTRTKLDRVSNNYNYVACLKPKYYFCL